MGSSTKGNGGEAKYTDGGNSLIRMGSNIRENSKGARNMDGVMKLIPV